MAASYSIVFVCSGNRFRSPLAAAFVKRLTLGLPVTVESFGTLELGEVPALPEARRIGLWCGLDLSGHRARCLSPGSMAHSDLIIGFEPQHVRRAVVDAGAPRERAFTLTEIVSLLDGVLPGEGSEIAARARQRVDEAAARRGSDLHPDAESIRDPLGRSWRTYCMTAESIRELSISLVSALFGPLDESVLPPLPGKIPRP